MSKVSVYNEWDPIEEIIVGDVSYARFPEQDRGFAVLNADVIEDGDGPFEFRIPDRVIEETREDLANLSELLRGQGITVRHPEPIEHRGKIATPDWQADHFFCYCPRDVLLAVGDSIIETPGVFRSRYFETHAYRELLHEYLLSGSRWFSAPKPRLLDDLYDENSPVKLRNTEVAFDAANCLRAGRDIFYQVSDSGNELGAVWLQGALGEEYRVHPCHDLNSTIHIDSTLTLLRPGLVLANPSRVTETNMPPLLQKWDALWAPEMVEYSYSECKPWSSAWLGMNLLMLSPELAVVDSHQEALIRLLGRHGIDVIPALLRHGRTLGGGIHCVTLDVRRAGGLEDYFA